MLVIVLGGLLGCSDAKGADGDEAGTSSSVDWGEDWHNCAETGGDSAEATWTPDPVPFLQQVDVCTNATCHPAEYTVNGEGQYSVGCGADQQVRVRWMDPR